MCPLITNRPTIVETQCAFGTQRTVPSYAELSMCPVLLAPSQTLARWNSECARTYCTIRNQQSTELSVPSELYAMHRPKLLHGTLQRVL